MRFKIQIEVGTRYEDFRKVSYLEEGSNLEVLKELWSKFNQFNYKFILRGLSRMPAYCQIKKHSYQREQRLIVKRPQDESDFPFQVMRDEDHDCNYIDCALDGKTCSLFKLSLVDIDLGQNMSDENKLIAKTLFKEFNNSI